MSETSLAALLWTALSLGFVHTLLGPDHYLPFVALARAGQWSLRKTLLVTVLCGIGHVLSSVVLGLVGVGAGLALSSLESVEDSRAELAVWALIGFGVLYGGWGLWRAMREKPHAHPHVHANGTAPFVCIRVIRG